MMRLMGLTKGEDTRLAGLLAAKKVVLTERGRWASGANVERATRYIIEAIDLLIRVEWKKTHKGAKG